MGAIGASLDTKLKEALKTGDARLTSVLRLLKAALVNEQKARMHELSDAEDIMVVRRELKKREDSINAFRQAGQEDRARAEEAEADILRAMLPPEMTDADIRAIADKVVSEAGADNFGKAMGAVMKEVGTAASGDRVKQILQEVLANKTS